MTVLRGAAVRAAAGRDYERSEACAAEWRSLAEQAGDEYQLLRAMNSAALAACGQGRFDIARAQLIEIRRAGQGRSATATWWPSPRSILEWSHGGPRDFHAALDYASAAAELFRKLGDDGGVVSALESCGWNSLSLQDPGNARAQFLEALSLAARLRLTRGVAIAGAGLAASMVALNEEQRAAQLASAATSLLEELEAGFDDELQQEIHERAIADAKSALGNEAFAAAWARGEAMTPDEIVTFAQAG